MIQLITAYLSTALIFALIDIIWISQVARPYIFSKVEHLLGLNATAAIVFYVLYIGGILLFAIYPALQATDANVWRLALVMGCLFGFFCYMTYDLTNMATLKDWSWSIVLLDVAWGTLITGLSATGGYLITRALIG